MWLNSITYDKLFTALGALLRGFNAILVYAIQLKDETTVYDRDYGNSDTRDIMETLMPYG